MPATAFGRYSNRAVRPQLKTHQLVVFPSPTMSLPRASSNFQSVLDAALDSYARQTGVDLTRHPSAEKLQNCHSPEDIIQLLSERETAFKDYRDKYRNLIDRLRPIVKVVHAFSGVLGEAAGLVSFRHCRNLQIYLSPFQVPFQPTKVIFAGIDVLLSVRCTFLLYIGCLKDTRQLLASVQAMTHFLTFLNASQISLTDSISTPRGSHCPLPCRI